MKILRRNLTPLIDMTVAYGGSAEPKINFELSLLLWNINLRCLHEFENTYETNLPPVVIREPEALTIWSPYNIVRRLDDRAFHSLHMIELVTSDSCFKYFHDRIGAHYISPANEGCTMVHEVDIEFIGIGRRGDDVHAMYRYPSRGVEPFQPEFDDLSCV